jgi:hypothetical protein
MTSTNFRNKPNAAQACGCGAAAASQRVIPALPPIDKRGDILCRISDRFRMRYSVTPGLYSIGSPADASPVVVTANYRLTCDHVRTAMEKTDVWVLVLDTKGINVWCAAGKGTFGTKELVQRIAQTGLETFVKHRTLILPQLGAPGVAAHEVTKATGFHVVYGPIRSRDIPAFLAAGNKAEDAMRMVGFPLWERFILTPMEFFPALRKYLWILLGSAFLMGLQPSGILFKPALMHSWPIIAFGLFAVCIGTVFVPLLLPWIPFRSFAAKGMLIGAMTMLPAYFLTDSLFLGSYFLSCAVILFFTAVASYAALNFTGCTPFTNISGVKKEMRYAVPAYVAACAVSGIFIILFKLNEWGVL